MKKYISILLLIFTISAFSQVNNKSDLTIDQIMQAEKFVGYSPTNIFWSDDSKTIYFDWNPELKPITSLYKYSIDTKKVSSVSVNEEMKLNQSYDEDISNDKSKKVFIKNGDIYLHNYITNQTKNLITTFSERESNVSFSTDTQTIVFQKDENLFSFDLKNGTTKQITNIKSGSDSSSKKTDNKQDAWLRQQQLDLFEVLRDRKERKDLQKEHSEKLKVEKPKTIFLKGKSISNLRLSKNGRFVSYKLSDYPKNKRTTMPHFVTESGYVEDQNTRPKVGEKRASHELWVFDVKRDSAYQVDISSLSGIYNKPFFLKDYDKDFTLKYDKPKGVNFFAANNNFDDTDAVLEIRSDDNKDRWFAKIDFENGKLIEVNHQHDEAWIGGPGIPWWNGGANYGWLDNDNIWYHSEKTGFSHIYKTNINSKKEKVLTKGNWEVHDAVLSNDKKSLFLTTNQDNTGERQLYKLNLKSRKSVKLTNQIGNNEVTISPDEKHFAIRQSFSNKPWELYLLENKNGAKETQLTHSTTLDFKKYDWRIPQNIQFKASDGIDVTARLYTPKGGSNGKPAVVFVHGAGYLQNAHKWWSTYFREYMFNNFLVDNGYTVLDIDYRASKGYGRDYRTAIYRHMGGKDLSDHVDGVNYLVKELGVDKNNVGIYGGSYGGFISIMALFNAPETFKSGAAVRSVTDWAHYNHAYTSNILNTPVTDSVAFQKSSPINFAEGFEGNLLMLHGMVDDNVHFQDVVRLTQKLIELKKENWEMALYPVERHSFIEPSSWADEYKRIFKLFESTLKEGN
ncbi:MAG: prolyl oligopeptidase family serine peptidase [Flavobacteriaceae bacterium]|nr:prolyl oligopeptidase family serine peptidase [Flavobacteriaceae bacterium]